MVRHFSQAQLGSQFIVQFCLSLFVFFKRLQRSEQLQGSRKLRHQMRSLLQGTRVSNQKSLTRCSDCNHCERTFLWRPWPMSTLGASATSLQRCHDAQNSRSYLLLLESGYSSQIRALWLAAEPQEVRFRRSCSGDDHLGLTLGLPVAYFPSMLGM